MPEMVYAVQNVVRAERPDIKSQFNSMLYQLLLDPSERVCFEAILCVLGKFDNAERYCTNVLLHIALSLSYIYGCMVAKTMVLLPQAIW